MTISPGDILEKLNELMVIVDTVGKNIDEIKDIETDIKNIRTNQNEMQTNILKLMEGQQRILERLEYKEEVPIIIPEPGTKI
ncbi:Uncharacterised protein [uncultured archaeon]|nr:Uncharacterised protein [uncultured archaeon]